LVEVRPEGGRFHQIRAQLSAAGHPIKGDVKYGARRGEPDRSIALHARSLKFAHPFTGAPLCIQAPLPGTGLWPRLSQGVDLDR
jgi:23S rRNA pseudouridine1911/1915/1917 synthase